VEKFVRGRANGIAGLALSHRLGALPRLRLHGGPGGESESARVDRWRGEDIEAYLADRLEGYAPRTRERAAAALTRPCAGR